MVRTASAVAALLFAAGLASGAAAQTPKTNAAEPAAVAVPLAMTPTAELPSIKEAMQSQAAVDAPPPPPAPPPPAPTAAPSVAVAVAPLAPAERTVKFAFAPPSTGAMKAAKAAAAAKAGARPMKLAAADPVPTPKTAASATQIAARAPAAPVQVAAVAQVDAAPDLTKVAVSAPAVAREAVAAAVPKAEPAVVRIAAAALPTPAAPPAPPTPAAPGANVLVAHRVTDAAGAFDAWTEKAARIDGRFTDAHGVSAALTDASAVQTEQLEAGAVAFGALAALQDPVFVQSAKALAAMGGDHDAAAAILLKTPSEVMALQGAEAAAAFAAQALSKRALAVTEAGASVRKAAYSMQVDPWARTAVPTPEKRLADAKAASATPIALDEAASGLLMKRLVELRTSRQSVSLPPGAPTPLVTRSLALAAMIVLGEADEAHAAMLTPLLAEAKSSDCLKMAKLNLFQCLSVAGPHYEDAFCIGQHGLGETAQCLVSAAGVAAPTPVAAPPVLLAVAGPAPSAGVSVPLALLAEGGAEGSAAFEAKPVDAPAPVAAPASPPRESEPILLAELTPQATAAPSAVSAVDQPTWAPEPAPQAPPARAYARQQQPQPQAAPRYDRGRAYLWDRQTRSADYVPGYGAAPYSAYADPRQAYGRYAQPSRPAYDTRYADEDDDAPTAPAPRAYPQRGYWNDR